MSQGWFRAHRSAFEPDHPVIGGGPFCRIAAWLDLVGMAAWEPRVRNIRGVVVELVRGEFVVSLRFLAERWGWSKDKVRRFLTALEEDAMLATQSETPSGQVYLIVKYDLYQSPDDDQRDSDRDSDATAARQNKEIQELEEQHPTATSRASEPDREPIKAEMWAHVEAWLDRLNVKNENRREIVRARCRHVIDGDLTSRWKVQATGKLVPWEDRPRLFRAAFDETTAAWQEGDKGRKVGDELYYQTIPREYDPHDQAKANQPAPGSEAEQIRNRGRQAEKPGATRTKSGPNEGPVPVASVTGAAARHKAEGKAQDEERARITAWIDANLDEFKQIIEDVERQGGDILRAMPDQVRLRSIEAKARVIVAERIAEEQREAA
jgi:hypothetical protein